MNQLQSQQSELLDKIDELRAIEVGGLVELPQIIVCGNQSSGKSSILEAISRVRCPSKSNICTRIDPSSTGFSDDVLKVEISGAEKSKLILVDLPGLYCSSTNSEQNAQGMGIVRRLTEKDMKSSRGIILAVIGAKADYHIQKVLNIAQTFDPKYETLLGIVTQPGIPEAGSEEQETYVLFIKNEKSSCNLASMYCATARLRRATFPMMREMFKKRSSLKGDDRLPSLETKLGLNVRGIISAGSYLVMSVAIVPGHITDMQERIARNEQTGRNGCVVHNSSGATLLDIAVHFPEDSRGGDQKIGPAKSRNRATGYCKLAACR
ncbi:Dynamin [Penicillium fimorum]|uniref:Dynamin n=1 Tax=Penicillium fimorum TaxID=1882269 RepID=A0A9W9XY69_9EURO|nr:Dynamin [Penicillium fimorum]